jgi:hypothetical protein
MFTRPQPSSPSCRPASASFTRDNSKGVANVFSPHLIRAPQESTDPRLAAFYERLLDVLRHDVTRNGQWQLLECVPAWEGNASNGAFIAFAWLNPAGERLLVTVNYAPHQSQCYVRLPFSEIANRGWRLSDQLAEARYDREGDDLLARGLYLDVPPWQAAVFTLTQRD